MILYPEIMIPTKKVINAADMDPPTADATVIIKEVNRSPRFSANQLHISRTLPLPHRCIPCLMHKPSKYGRRSRQPGNNPVKRRKEPKRHNTALKAYRTESPLHVFDSSGPSPMESDNGMPSDEEHVLNSGAHRTHLRKPSPQMRELTQTLTTNTVTSSTSMLTHAGITQVITGKGITMRLPVVANPQLRSNLVSVQFIARQWGLVVFSSDKAYIINTKQPSVPTLVGTAYFSKTLTF